MDKVKRANRWVGECLRKKPLKEEWCDNIIKAAKADGITLYKYACPHCARWHVTRRPNHNGRMNASTKGIEELP